MKKVTIYILFLLLFISCKEEKKEIAKVSKVEQTIDSTSKETINNKVVKKDTIT